ncbi:hypothetical protein [Sandaracinus amylolyticus]|uniref:hypothetical protein n=1 Tax=Sandaracinus amylolyticus TaxID=927083 RepID=UPI0012ED27BA|nr:hypothetical protein [Sandaracinus amylolyticus]
MKTLFLMGDCEDREHAFEILFERAPTPAERLAIVEAAEAELGDSGARMSWSPWLWWKEWAVAPIEHDDRQLFDEMAPTLFDAAARVVPVRQVVLLNAIDDGDGRTAPPETKPGPRWDRWLAGSDPRLGVFTRDRPRDGKAQSEIDDAVESARRARRDDDDE